MQPLSSGLCLELPSEFSDFLPSFASMSWCLFEDYQILNRLEYMAIRLPILRLDRFEHRPGPQL